MSPCGISGIGSSAHCDRTGPIGLRDRSRLFRATLRIPRAENPERFDWVSLRWPYARSVCVGQPYVSCARATLHPSVCSAHPSGRITCPSGPHRLMNGPGPVNCWQVPEHCPSGCSSPVMSSSTKISSRRCGPCWGNTPKISKIRFCYLAALDTAAFSTHRRSRQRGKPHGVFIGTVGWNGVESAAIMSVMD